MKIVKIVSTLFLLWICLFFFGCTIVKHEVIEKENSHRLSWIDDQTVLVSRLDNEESWIYSFRTSHRINLPDLISHKEPIPSPSGEYLLSTEWKPGYLSIVRPEQAYNSSAFHHFPIPRTPIADENFLKFEREIAFWISNNDIFFEQFNVESGQFQCHIFNIDRQSWEKPAHCFDLMQFSLGITKVDYIGNNLYAIFTSDEGRVSVNIVKWTSADGIEETEFPHILLGMGAPFQLFFEDDGESFFVLSSAPLLGKEDDTINPETDYYRRDNVLYHWTKSNGYRETGIRLNPHIALRSVNSKLTAWIDMNKGEICRGNLERHPNCQKLQRTNCMVEGQSSKVMPSKMPCSTIFPYSVLSR